MGGGGGERERERGGGGVSGGKLLELGLKKSCELAYN